VLDSVLDMSPAARHRWQPALISGIDLEHLILDI
jgi:hypothetical protein